jgi:nucleoid-associated protein YgaU
VPDSDDAIIRGIVDLRRNQRVHGRTTDVGDPMGTPKPSHYAVLPGDTLWDIAGKVLKTDDLRAIARYWPRIHRENRDVIGADPNLLRPGQVLTLPRIAPQA